MLILYISRRHLIAAMTMALEPLKPVCFGMFDVYDISKPHDVSILCFVDSQYRMRLQHSDLSRRTPPSTPCWDTCVDKASNESNAFPSYGPGANVTRFDDGVRRSDASAKKFEMVNATHLPPYASDGFPTKPTRAYARLVITSPIGVTTRSRSKVVAIPLRNPGDCASVTATCVESPSEYILSLLSASTQSPAARQ